MDIYEQYKNAVIRVKAVHQGLNEAGDPQVTIKYSTGFFISKEGHVITNASVAYEADRLWIVHKGVEYAAENIGDELNTNFSLLRTFDPPKDFDIFHLTDSANLPPIGSFIMRISTPLEFEPSPSIGLVTGHDSSFFKRDFPCTYIRTSIPGGPGEGGAPIVDMKGKLVGFTIVSIEDLPTTYVLPARAALRVRDDLLFSGKLNYGWLGFQIEERGSRERGLEVLLAEIIDDSPAQEAGIQVGDKLMQIGEFTINSKSDVQNASFYLREGQFVSVEVLRNDEPVRFDLRVAPRPENEPVFTPAGKTPPAPINTTEQAQEDSPLATPTE